MKRRSVSYIGNKAFTLIELLAVIVILAVIALISTPIILNIINKSKKSAFTDTAYGIVESARLYYTEQILDGGIESNKEFKFDGSNNELSFNGTKPKGGSLILTDKGEISLAIHNGIWCATKAKNESKVTLKKYEESTCVIPDDIEVPTTPVEPTCPSVEIMGKNINTCDTMTNDPDHNLRYVGANPNNFVLFNNELWRVIGIFNGQAKIIRNDGYISIEWDENNVNDWSQATSQLELNGTYLNSIEETSKGMIDGTHVWNLGGTPSSTSEMTREKMYSYERGTTVYEGRPIEWIGAIGLLYASDYGYSTSATDEECDATMNGWDGSGNVENCKNNSWIYNSRQWWTLTPISTDGNTALIFNSGGKVSKNSTGNANRRTMNPTLYLKSTVKIIDGEGTSEQPFELSL